MTATAKTFVDGQAVDGSWVRLDDEALLPEAGGVLVSAARWKRERDVLLSRGNAGVLVHPADEDEAELGEIAGAPLVVIAFPKFSDGRGYSFARLLRDRHGFRGDLRAAGEVLIDQVVLMLRCGFTSFEVAHAPTIAALEAGSVKGLSHVYQSPAPGSQWRRRPGGPVSNGEAA